MKLKKFFFSLPVRIILTVLALSAVIFGAYLLANGYVKVPCFFYEITGLYCPGCGTGRAARDILALDFASAFSHNPLAVIFAPFLAYYAVKMLVFYLVGKDILPFFKLSIRLAVAIVASIFIFWILRNIPFFPFNLLAP
ncbi:MAG: DUF2752 domain-containing protein [Clostridia bacterium]|nr:DUF2752 domain-containing protein [Clostridia bacterium]